MSNTTMNPATRARRQAATSAGSHVIAEETEGQLDELYSAFEVFLARLDTDAPAHVRIGNGVIAPLIALLGSNEEELQKVLKGKGSPTPPKAIGGSDDDEPAEPDEAAALATLKGSEKLHDGIKVLLDRVLLPSHPDYVKVVESGPNAGKLDSEVKAAEANTQLTTDVAAAKTEASDLKKKLKPLHKAADDLLEKSEVQDSKKFGGIVKTPVVVFQEADYDGLVKAVNGIGDAIK